MAFSKVIFTSFLVSQMCLVVLGAQLGASLPQQEHQRLKQKDQVAPASGEDINWLKPDYLESIEHISIEDYTDYQLIGHGLVSKLAGYNSYEQVHNYLIRLRAFAERNNYLTESYLRSIRPLYMEEYTSLVSAHLYSGLELVATILQSAGAESLLEATRSGDWSIISDMYNDYVRLSEQHRSQRADSQEEDKQRSELEARLALIQSRMLCKLEKYPLLLDVFSRLLLSSQQE